MHKITSMTYKRLLRISTVLILGLLLLMTNPGPVKSQTAAFSQFFNNPMYYNPAFTGSQLGMQARMQFRNQAGDLSDSYDNLTFSLDMAERNLPGSGGFGLFILSDFDGIGFVENTTLRITYAARIQLSNRIVTQVGVGPSFVNRRVNWDRLIFSDQLDPHEGYINDTQFIPPHAGSLYYPDLSVGGLVQFHGESQRFSTIVTTLGAAIDHVFRPDISFSGAEHRMPVKYVVSGNILFDNVSFTGNRLFIDRSMFRLNPGFIFENHRNVNTYSIGLNGYKSYVYSGIWGRVQEYDGFAVSDIIFMLGLEIPMTDNSSIKVMYSYDYLIGETIRGTGNTHELSVIYQITNFSLFGQPDLRPRTRDYRRLECPSF